MKKLGKYIIAFFLGLFARGVIRRYAPKIIMVTGSVGKTSTKDAVAAVLARQFFVRKSAKSFNSELGVPFTIFGVTESPWLNPFAWLRVWKSVFALLFLPNHYPKVLVLEVGADKPGDLARMLRIATPDAVVVTRLPEVPVHVEVYASPEAVREEEFSPAYALAPEAPLILSADDTYAREAARRLPAQVTTYGLAEDADVRIEDIGFLETDDAIAGMRARVSCRDKQGELVVRGAVGRAQMFPAAAALATTCAFGASFAEALEALEDYMPPPGRGRLLPGLHGSQLVDDSYNASPVAVEQALETLHAFPGAKRRIAVVGDMLELGRYSVAEHARIGALARANADIVVAVGVRARAFAKAPGAAEVLLFDTARAAAEALPGIVQEGDVILLKGSQSVRVERITKALLADPADAVHLVRQEKRWASRA